MDLLSRHGSSLDCGWTSRLPDVERGADVLNKQLRTGDKIRSSSLIVGLGSGGNLGSHRVRIWKILYLTTFCEHVHAFGIHE